MQLSLFATKRCTKCEEVKTKAEFHKGKSWCKECRKKPSQEYHQHNIERIHAYDREYYQRNKEKIKTCVKQYAKENSEKIVERNRRYYRENKEACNNRNMKGYEEHKEERKKYMRDHPETQKRYMKTKKGKLAKKKSLTKRNRKLGFNLLNKSFSVSVWHHINNIDVVAIPVDIHRKFLTGETENHRDLILEY